MSARIAILISGRGSNMSALLAAFAAPDYPAQAVLVLSDRPGAAGLDHAHEAGVPGEALDRNAFASRQDFEAALDSRLKQAGADLVCLAGFMRVLSPGFVETWRDRLVNIHPSLLPAFPGLDTHKRALDAGVKLHGCTVHYVRAGVDDGPIIGQAAVPVLPDDTQDTLAARVLAAEHRLYPACVRLVLEGSARTSGAVAHLDGARAPEGAFFMPDPES